LKRRTLDDFLRKLRTTSLIERTAESSQPQSSRTADVIAAIEDIGKVKDKGFPYSLSSVGPGADPGVQAVSPQVTIRYTPGCRLPLLSAWFAVTFPAAEHHRPLAGITQQHCCRKKATMSKQYSTLSKESFEL